MDFISVIIFEENNHYNGGVMLNNLILKKQITFNAPVDAHVFQIVSIAGRGKRDGGREGEAGDRF